MRLLDRLLVTVAGVRCPLCFERHRQLSAHLNIDHFGEIS